MAGRANQWSRADDPEVSRSEPHVDGSVRKPDMWPESGDNREDIAIVIESFGRRIRIHLNDKRLLDPILKHLPPGARMVEPVNLDKCYQLEWVEASESPIGRQGYHMFVDDTFAGVLPEPENVVATLESRLQHYVAEFANPYLFVHAGVVRFRDRAIVLPGKSFSGKSTLVKALVDSGCDYLSDEYAVFDKFGRVYSYPRRLSLREGPLGPAGRINLSHRTPFAGLNEKSHEVGLVALLRYDLDGVWQVERLTEAQAIMGLCEHTVAIQRRPKDAFAFLGRVARDAVVVQGTRGDVHEAVTRLLKMALQGQSNQIGG